MKKNLLSLAVAAGLGLASASASALVLKDFTVNEGAVAGTPANSITADKIVGGYTEMFTVTGPNSFITTAYWNAGQFFSNDGADNVADTQDVYLGAPNGVGGYGMYALFQSAGTFNITATGVKFTGGTGSIQIFIDPNKNTTKALGLTGFDPIALGNNADDYLIASSSLLAMGDGNMAPGGIGTANGNFDLLFKAFTLEDPAGSDYFVDPDPFYLMLDVSGQFVNFAVEGNQRLNGSADAVFLPEPGTIALLGLGLAGMGLALRRRAA